MNLPIRNIKESLSRNETTTISSDKREILHKDLDSDLELIQEELSKKIEKIKQKNKAL